MTSRRVLPALLLLFIGSGCAALIYEIVWFQLLQLVIGSSAISLGVLLGTFMGGMCLGSLALSYVVPARQHPLRIYAFLEMGGSHARRRVVARLLLRRQHRRRRTGQHARRVLSASRVRHVGRDVRRRGDQRGGRAWRTRDREAGAVQRRRPDGTRA